MKSSYFIDYANGSTHGMNLPRLGTDKALLAVLPLPPLPEQHRIVERVDQLMALCDRLEEQLQQSRTDGVQLMEATVRHLSVA